MSRAVFTVKRDPELRSKRKLCFCGGHSHNDHKKCKHHHSTYQRLTHQLCRRLKLKMQDEKQAD